MKKFSDFSSKKLRFSGTCATVQRGRKGKLEVSWFENMEFPGGNAVWMEDFLDSYKSLHELFKKLILYQTKLLALS